MDLKEAIKTCLKAEVNIEYYWSINSCVWLPKEVFFKWFGNNYVVKEDNGRLELLTVLEDGIEYKCHHWKGE